MADPTSQLTVPEAIKITKQHEHSDIDPAVTTFLAQKFEKILERDLAQSSTQILKEDLTVLNCYYRGIFDDNEVAQQAVQRFREQHSGKLINIQVKKENKDFHGETSEPIFKRSIAADKGSIAKGCYQCRKRKVKCDRQRPSCVLCRRANYTCVYVDGENDDFEHEFGSARMGVLKESGPMATSSHQDSVQLQSLSSFAGSDAADKDHIADPCERCGQRKIECNGEHPESPKIISQDPQGKIDISFGIHGERNQDTISRDGQAKQQGKPTPQTWEANIEHLKSSETISLLLSRFRVHVSNGEEYSLINLMKLWVQFLTGESWDWWPLNPCFRQLLDDEIRVKWCCDLGHAHSTVLSKDSLSLPVEALTSKAAVRSVPSERKKSEPPSEGESNTSASQGSGSETSAGNSSSATQDSGSSDEPDDEAGFSKGTDPSGESAAVDIVPPSNLTGFVLFGVHGSKRLRNACLRLAQIDVTVYKDDDSFFDEIIVQYKKLRGFFRRLFSIWGFHACEFIMFYRSNPNEIMEGPREMPSRRNRDYDYNANRNPPILSTVFNANFYGCKKACIKSQLDFFCLLHECRGRNYCGNYRVLDRLPKRRRKWDIDRDEEAEEAWGLNTIFAVSFYRVTLYHMLILVGPITFWGLWLQKWPSDWQNASVPFFAVVVLLSLFWLPFAHNASPTDRRKSLKYKSI